MQIKNPQPHRVGGQSSLRQTNPSSKGRLYELHSMGTCGMQEKKSKTGRVMRQHVIRIDSSGNVGIGPHKPINCSAYLSSTKKPPLANRRGILIYSDYVTVYSHPALTPAIQPVTRIAIAAQMILSSCFLIILPIL